MLSTRNFGSLIPKSNKKINLPVLKFEDTKNIIRNSKNSWTLCQDNISMNVIKKLNKNIAPYLSHLFNNMIRTSIYPQRLKVTKILPILKPQKNKYNINGYRPVNICNR